MAVSQMAPYSRLHSALPYGPWEKVLHYVGNRVFHSGLTPCLLGLSPGGPLSDITASRALSSAPDTNQTLWMRLGDHLRHLWVLVCRKH